MYWKGRQFNAMAISSPLEYKECRREWDMPEADEIVQIDSFLLSKSRQVYWGEQTGVQHRKTIIS